MKYFLLQLQFQHRYFTTQRLCPLSEKSHGKPVFHGTKCQKYFETRMKTQVAMLLFNNQFKPSLLFPGTIQNEEGHAFIKNTNIGKGKIGLTKCFVKKNVIMLMFNKIRYKLIKKHHNIIKWHIMLWEEWDELIEKLEKLSVIHEKLEKNGYYVIDSKETDQEIQKLVQKLINDCNIQITEKQRWNPKCTELLLEHVDKQNAIRLEDLYQLFRGKFKRDMLTRIAQGFSIKVV